MINFVIGSVLKVYYFNVLSKKRKMFIFTGICKKLNRISKTVTLENFKGKELVHINFVLNSPYIVAISELDNYNFKKLNKNLILTIKTKILRSSSDISAISRGDMRLDPYDYIYAVRVPFVERQRLRRKFRI